MIRIAYIADIQAETWDQLPAWLNQRLENIDLYILGGDIGEVNSLTGTALEVVLRRIRKQTTVPIIYILGNHEYYNSDGQHYQNLIRIRQICENLDIILLDRQSYYFQGYQILGCTLWSDVNTEHHLDYHLNRLSMSLSEYQYYHQRDWIWLREKLETADLNHTIVVTHYTPDCRLLSTGHDEYNNQSMYCSNLWQKNEKPILWLTGHVHNNQKIREGQKLLISHSGGRHKEFANPFKPIVIDVVSS